MPMLHVVLDAERGLSEFLVIDNIDPPPEN